MIMNSRVIKERHMRKFGYVIKTVEYDMKEFGMGESVIVKQCYTPDGHFIGDINMARIICKKYNIKPQYIDENSNICQIGYCEDDGLWYGWSHRAIMGFDIGSTCKEGDIQYTPDNVDELYDSLKKYHSEEELVKEEDGVLLKFGSDPHTSGGYKFYIGRGWWIAETKDEAKQMAIDFARGVS